MSGMALSALIVDDTEEQADVLREELASRGFCVHGDRVDGRGDLVAALQSQPWDVILCADRLSTLSIPSVLSLVQELSPETPVLLIEGACAPPPLPAERSTHTPAENPPDHLPNPTAGNPPDRQSQCGPDFAAMADQSVAGCIAERIPVEHLALLVPVVVRELRKTQMARLGMGPSILDRRSDYDPLTGVFSRHTVTGRLLGDVDRARETGKKVAVLFIDIDGFVDVNESFGYAAGDRVLQVVAQRLLERTGRRGVVGRCRGDQFMVTLLDFDRADVAAALALEILNAVSEPIMIEEVMLDNREAMTPGPFDDFEPDAGGQNARDVELFLTASIGGSIYPDDALDADSLLRHADAAFRIAKERGASSRFFRAAEHGPDPARARIAAFLRHAVDRSEFVLHFQPQMHILTGRLAAFEALVRWNHPDRGLIPPGAFLPLAEQNGLIVPIGEWVLKEACRQANRWERAGTPVRVYVNLSARQLDAGNLVTRVCEIIRSSGVRSELLGLELTETALMHSESEYRSLADLGALGITMAIDDFGVGVSLLSLLRRMPATTVKIDRNLIAGLPYGGQDRAMVLSIIQLAHALGLIVVAEGVTSHQQLDVLRDMGCDIAQGFLISEPVTADNAGEVLQHWQRADSWQQIPDRLRTARPYGVRS
ncbi:MAG: EAL domain-containing protein [Capsulimonadaceae bacterium]